MPDLRAHRVVSLNRTTALVLLVALGGCLGGPAPGADDSTTTPSATAPTTTQSTTTATTTAPHTYRGTSHNAQHLTVRAYHDLDNVTVTLAPGGDSATYQLEAGEQRSVTQEIHDRGHQVRVVVERGDEVVFERTISDYQYYRVAVQANDTSVWQSEV